jgi:hypothetical protein
VDASDFLTERSAAVSKTSRSNVVLAAMLRLAEDDTAALDFLCKAPLRAAGEHPFFNPTFNN